MGIINDIFNIPEKVFLFFIKSVWFIFSRVLELLWNRHMISIWDYFNMWRPFSFIPRSFKSFMQELNETPLTWKSRLNNILNSLTLGIIPSLNSNPPDPQIPLLLEGIFYFCHIIILISLIILMKKIHRFVKKLDK